MRPLARTILLLAIGAASATSGHTAESLSPVSLGDAPIFERASPWGDVTYTPGRGLHLGNTGLTIGGYTSVILARSEGEDGKLEIDPLSLFAIWDPLPRLHVLGELQYDDVVEVDERGRTSSADDDLTIDRLYADVTLSDLLTVRAGVFLTPVGRWNVIHIAPLVWTTEQPLVTELPFDPSLTGVMLHGAVFPGDGVLRYAVYDQFGAPIEGNPEFDPADHGVGARLEYTSNTGWSVGSSYLASDRDGSWNQLGGLDVLWDRDRFELMGEFAVSKGAGLGQWGAYLQGVYGLTERLSLVQRFEHYSFPSPDGSVNLVTLGLAFRPLNAVVLKAEYVIADRTDPENSAGFYASMATLF